MTEPNTPEKPSTPNSPTEDENILQITVGSYVFAVALYENETAKQFAKMLPQTITMGDLNENEKYCYLSQNLSTHLTLSQKISAGDLMLYGSNCLVLFYKSFATSYSYTNIGKIINIKGLETALGQGSVTVTFSLKEQGDI